MKRWLMLIMMALCLSAAPAGAEHQIAVATDLHYLSPALTDNGPGFTRLVEAADGKVMLYIDPLCEAFTEEIIARQPDCLILSGDLTFNGEKQSHIDLAAKLARIEAAGIPVLVLPGNHDLNGAAYAFEGEGWYRTEHVTQAEFRQIYGAMGFDDALSCDPASLSYVWALSPAWRIVMLDVNTPEAPGAVRAETLGWLEAQLADAEAAGARVIAVSHQNLHGHNALFTSGFVIQRREELAALYADAPVACNLSGHMHIQHVLADENTPEIATSALSVYPNQYGIMTLGEQVLYRTAATDVSAWAARQGRTDEALLDFAAYAQDFFAGTAFHQAESAAAGDADAAGLAQWFAHLNTCYFSGRMDLAELTGDHLARWAQQAGFMPRYIQSMLLEPPADHTQTCFELP